MVIVVFWLKLRGLGGKTLDMLVDNAERWCLARVKFGSFQENHKFYQLSGQWSKDVEGAFRADVFGISFAAGGNRQ